MSWLSNAGCSAHVTGSSSFRKSGLLALLFLVCTCSAVRAEEFLAEVIEVTDGDTVVVLRDDNRIRVRLADIDAPEGGQEHGSPSRQALLEMALHKQVKVHGLDTDRYRRLVGRISAGELNINQELVRRGMAWYYSRYRKDETLEALQSEARQAKRGLWAQDNPVPPWQWRKANRQSKAAAKSHTRQ